MKRLQYKIPREGRAQLRGTLRVRFARMPVFSPLYRLSSRRTWKVKRKEKKRGKKRKKKERKKKEKERKKEK
jgi:hypothetical protein